jgi:hypothetical protein
VWEIIGMANKRTKTDKEQAAGRPVGQESERHPEQGTSRRKVRKDSSRACLIRPDFRPNPRGRESDAGTREQSDKVGLLRVFVTSYATTVPKSADFCLLLGWETV